MPERLHVHISGRVQGVGYRQATFEKATRLGMTGWVRNIPDGRVEAVFEGSRDLQNEILAWCRKGPAFAKVIDIDVAFEEYDTENSRFEIRF